MQHSGKKKSNCIYRKKGRCALMIKLDFNKLTADQQCVTAFRKLVRSEDILVEVWYLEQRR